MGRLGRMAVNGWLKQAYTRWLAGSGTHLRSGTHLLSSNGAHLRFGSHLLSSNGDHLRFGPAGTYGSAQRSLTVPKWRSVTAWLSLTVQERLSLTL